MIDVDCVGGVDAHEDVSVREDRGVVLMPLFYDSVLQLKATVLASHSSKETSLQCCFYLYLFLWSMESRAEMKTFEGKTKGSLHSKTALLLSCIKSQRSPKTGDKN